MSLKRNAKCNFFFIWFILFVTRLSASSRVALRSAQEFEALGGAVGSSSGVFRGFLNVFLESDSE